MAKILVKSIQKKDGKRRKFRREDLLPHRTLFFSEIPRIVKLGGGVKIEDIQSNLLKK